MATESFFSNASLAYLASAGAGKDGKTYSIKPTDGSGDFTFSRGSNLAATRVGPTGLIEKGRENLLKQSNQFDTTWFNQLGTGTITSGQSGYDGSSDAWEITKDTSTFRSIRQAISTSGVLTYSAYIKAGTLSSTTLRIDTTAGATQVTFDLTDGSSTLVGGLAISHDSVDIGSGWYRCVVRVNAIVTNVHIYVDRDGTTAGSIYIQDAQLEIGLAATDYIESGATTGKAGILEDEPRFDYSGGATCPSLLLEPSRTNLVTQSEYYVNLSFVRTTSDFNVTTSPEGLQNASILYDTAVFNTFVIQQNYTASSGTSPITFSVFAKKQNLRYISIRLLDDAANASGNINNIIANYDLESGVVTDTLETGTPTNASADIEDYGNGWYRLIISMTKKSGITRTDIQLRFEKTPNSSYNGSAYLGTGNDGYYLYGLQLEEGSYPTSYIPNHSGGSVTRGEDTLTSLNITSIVTGTPFTWFLDLNEWRGSDTNVGDLYLSNPSGAQIQLRVRNDGYRIFYNSINGGTIYPIGASKTARKFCIKYDGSNFKLFRDGVLENTTASVGDTGWSGLSQAAGGSTLPLDQILLFNEALSDADCITLTTL